MTDHVTRGARWIAAVVAVAAVAGCTGEIPGAGGPGGASSSGRAAAGTGPGGPPGSSGAAAGSGPMAENAGLLPLRRLTRDQYDQAVASLLGDDSRPSRAFAADPKASSGFLESGLVADTDVRAYQDVAEAVAAGAIKRSKDLASCSAAIEDVCFQRFYESFGRRAFRRPLTDEERASFKTLYATARTTLKYDYGNTVRIAVQAVLQSPAFLYRWELGPAKPVVKDGLIKLTPHETASRLSFLLWNGLPDATLAAAADGGQLTTAADAEREARRMLADPRARATVEAFHLQWLDLEKVTAAPKDMTLYPKYSAALAQAMEDETRAFVDAVVLDGDGKLDTLLAGAMSFVNGPLADLYGAPGVTGTAIKRVDAVPHRLGLLTQASFLSSHAFAYDAHPILRGVTVFRRVLCGQIDRPSFPIPEPKPLKDGVSNRQRFTEHSSDPQCAGCHALFDPLGFAFENYGAIGEYRAKASGVTVDPSGVLSLPNGERPAFANAEELVRLLASSSDVRRCAGLQWGRYALGRLEGPEDRGSLDNAAAAFAAARYDVRELIVALVKSKTFLFRKPAPEEVTQ